MVHVTPLVEGGRVRVGELITHHFPLADFAEAVDTFNERRDGALKVILQP
jgi:L-iditol 2-dehydrogenase